ncbi:MAG: AmmeMemoRadiSam system protein A [Candidatus Poribacteria bacterium]
MNPKTSEDISVESQALLLKIARASIESHLKRQKPPKFEIRDQKLLQKRGAFVTLHKRGQLRGCIGYVLPYKPLHQTVAEMAVAAATEDPRFPNVTLNEMDEIDIEISALSTLKKIESIEEIEVGKHGLYMKQGIFSGLLLPQVATEYGWNRQEFLEHTCQKAGLPKDAWKDSKTEISIFSAQVFGEKELEG